MSTAPIYLLKRGKVMPCGWATIDCNETKTRLEGVQRKLERLKGCREDT